MSAPLKARSDGSQIVIQGHRDTGPPLGFILTRREAETLVCELNLAVCGARIHADQAKAGRPAQAELEAFL